MSKRCILGIKKKEVYFWNFPLKQFPGSPDPVTFRPTTAIAIAIANHYHRQPSPPNSYVIAVEESLPLHDTNRLNPPIGPRFELEFKGRIDFR